MVFGAIAFIPAGDLLKRLTDDRNTANPTVGEITVKSTEA